MLAKESRLTAAEVREILRIGRPVRGTTLSAKYITGQKSKAAVVVSTKVAKTAVERNRLRRSAYAALRTCLPSQIHAVIFLHKPLLNNEELTLLCSKLI